MSDEQPSAPIEQANEAPRGASDITLWVLLGGICLMLLVCVAFILIAA